MEKSNFTKNFSGIIIFLTGGIILSTALLSFSKSNRYIGAVYDGATGEPMASVAVGNGRDVVLTDENGRYSLGGWRKARFITVTVPTGYWSENYYISVSEAKTGYDFRLDKLDDDYTNHTFLQVTDSEVGKNGAGDWVDKLREVAAETNPAFIVHTGDICGVEGLRAHIKDMNSENMGVPVRYVIGNHDYVDWGDYGEALFESIYGPVMYSFDVGNIHYICTPITHGDADARYSKSDVAKFVENDLKYVSADKKTIVFNHNYCESDETGFVLSAGTTKVDLKKHNLLAWVFGHLHYNYLNEIDGVFNITTSRPDAGGIDASPATIRSVVIEGVTLAASDCYYNDFEETRTSVDCIWSASLEGNILYSDPAAHDGVAYVGTVDDGYPKNCVIAALDEETGEILWRYKTKNSIKSDIKIVGEKVVTQDSEGNVYCLDLSGKEVWTTTVELLEPNNSSNGIAVDENYIYCGAQHHIYCLNISDGSRVWDKTVSGGNASPSGFVLHGDMLIVGSHWNKLVAFDKKTGKTLWDNNENNLSFIISTPVVFDGNIYITSGGGIYEIDAETGKTLRYTEFEGYSFDSGTTPHIENNVLYTGTAYNGAAAIDLATMSILWTFKTGSDLIYTPPYGSGDISTVDGAVVPIGANLCFGASDGYLYIVDKSGNEIEKYNIGSPINQAPIIDGNNIIVADFSGNATRIKRK